MSRQTPGNYVPLDVNYPRDRAIRRAGPMAELLFVRSLAYSKGARSKGFIPDYDLPVVAVGLVGEGLPPVEDSVDALVREGLWVEVEEGWRIRSWDPWNGEDDARRESQSTGGSQGNHQRWHIDRNIEDPDCGWCTRPTPTSPPDVAPPSVTDSPTDVAPDSGTESQGKGREGKGSQEAPRGSRDDRTKRGTRCPPDFVPSAHVREQMASETGFTVDQLKRITVKFIDYWTAKPGKDGLKLDWDGTWRNWVRTEAERHPPPDRRLQVVGSGALAKDQAIKPWERM
jgi:hypothetical protein